MRLIQVFKEVLPIELGEEVQHYGIRTPQIF